MELYPNDTKPSLARVLLPWLIPAAIIAAIIFRIIMRTFFFDAYIEYKALIGVAFLALLLAAPLILLILLTVVIIRDKQRNG